MFINEAKNYSSPTQKTTSAPQVPFKASGHPVVDIGGKSYPVNKQTLDVDQKVLNRDLANAQSNFVTAKANGNINAMEAAKQQGAELRKAGATVEISPAATALGNYYKQDITVKKAMETKSVADLNMGIMKAKNDYLWAQKNNDKAGMEAAARLAENLRSLGGTISAGATFEEAKKMVYAPPKPTSSDLVKNFGQGVLDGAKTAVGDTLTALSHPIETAKGLGDAISHPIATGQAILNSLTTGYDKYMAASPEEKARLLGSGLAQTVIAVAGTKGTAGVVKAAQEVAGAGIKVGTQVIENAKVPMGPLVPSMSGAGSVNIPQSKVTEPSLPSKSVTPKPAEVKYGEHFTKTDNGKKVLKANVEYATPEGYKYTTDDKGRIANVEAKLELGKADRNAYAQRNVGGTDRLPNDEGGHLIASIFKGSGEIDNMVPMDATLNRSEYRTLENTWKKALNEGKEVKVNVEPIYKGDSLRPSKFEVQYTIDGQNYEVRLNNYEGGTS